MNRFSRIVASILAPDILSVERDMDSLQARYEAQLESNTLLANENAALAAKLTSIQNERIDDLKTVADNESLHRWGRGVFSHTEIPRPDPVPMEMQTHPTRRGMQQQAQRAAVEEIRRRAQEERAKNADLYENPPPDLTEQAS